MEGQEKCPSKCNHFCWVWWPEDSLVCGPLKPIYSLKSDTHILPMSTKCTTHKWINKYNINVWEKFYEQNEYFYSLITWWPLFTYAHTLYFYVCLCECVFICGVAAHTEPQINMWIPRTWARGFCKMPNLLMDVVTRILLNNLSRPHIPTFIFVLDVNWQS